MLVCFKYLHAGLGKVYRTLAKQPSADAEELYQKGIALKEGEGRNLREAFKKFKKAS